MKRKGKKRVLFYCLFITFVFSLLGLLLLNAYFRANIILTDNVVKQIEKGAYNYLTENENNEEIQLLKNGKKDEIYIPFEEIEDKGYISDIYNVSGVISVKYDGDYIVTYNNKTDNYLTIVYHSNGDVLDTYAKTIYCDNDNYLECLKNVEWPTSKDKNIDIKGFTLNSNYQNIMAKYDDTIYDLLSKNEYKIKHNKLNIYAITSKKFTMTVDNTLLGLPNEEVSCEALNWADSCNIKLPEFIDYDNLEYNTKPDNTGYKFFEDEKYTLTKNEVVYSIPDLNGKQIKTNIYSNNNNGYRLLFIIDNSLTSSNYNNLDNTITSIKETIDNITSPNVSYRLLTVNDNINEIVSNGSRRELKKGLKGISSSGNYNSNIIDSLITSYISDEIIIVVSENRIDSLKELNNKIYNISVNREDILDNASNYSYYPSEDNINLSNLKNIFETIFSDINANNSYVFEETTNLEIVDNMIKINTRKTNNVVIKVYGKKVVPREYLIFRNNLTYFAIKNFVIDNKVNISGINEMEIEYLK